MSTIVVGVDGSRGAAAALRFAAEEARIRGSDLRVVAAWDIPVLAYEAGITPVMLDITEFKRSAESTVRDCLEQAESELSDVPLTSFVRQGLAAEVLVAEAHDADLLVVGSRGLGGFRGLVLGSVSQQCAHHAPCAVVIVPAGAAETDDGA
jgi:nucleotide-binding universal stress UspA family protein